MHSCMHMQTTADDSCSDVYVAPTTCLSVCCCVGMSVRCVVQIVGTLRLSRMGLATAVLVCFLLPLAHTALNKGGMVLANVSTFFRVCQHCTSTYCLQLPVPSWRESLYTIHCQTGPSYPCLAPCEALPMLSPLHEVVNGLYARRPCSSALW